MSKNQFGGSWTEADINEPSSYCIASLGDLHELVNMIKVTQIKYNCFIFYVSIQMRFDYLIHAEKC